VFGDNFERSCHISRVNQLRPCNVLDYKEACVWPRIHHTIGEISKHDFETTISQHDCQRNDSEEMTVSQSEFIV